MLSEDVKTDIPPENVKSADQIFKEYGDFIYRTIRYKVKDKASVDDLYQDFFLSIALNPIPDGTKDIKGYLYKAIIEPVA